MENIGKAILIIGCVTVIVGIGWWLFPVELGWIGQLPGDIWIEKPGVSFQIPITSIIMLGVGLTVVSWMLSTWRGQ